jgi:hypothetical protein
MIRSWCGEKYARIDDRNERHSATTSLEKRGIVRDVGAGVGGGSVLAAGEGGSGEGGCGPGVLCTDDGDVGCGIAGDVRAPTDPLGEGAHGRGWEILDTPTKR